MNFIKQNKIILAGSFLAMIGGLGVIVGWVFDIALLKSVVPGYVTMKFNTAAGFLLAGVAMLLMIFGEHRPAKIFTRILSLIIFLIGLITLLQIEFGLNLGIDELFFTDVFSRNIQNISPGRMAQATAFCFFLLGLAFIGIQSKRKTAQLFSQYFLHFITAIGFIETIGYLFKVQVFYEFSYFKAMAIHTSALFMVVSVAVSNIHPSLGVTGLFTGNKTGNVMARRLFPLMLSSLFILGFIRLVLHRKGLIPVDFGFVMFAISFALVGLVLIWNTALTLNRIDEKRTVAEGALKLANQNLESVVENRTVALQCSLALLEESSKQNQVFVAQTPNAVGMVDCDMRYMSVSDQWLRDYNLVGRDIIGHSHYEIFPHIGEDRKSIYQQCLKEGITKKDESKLIEEDGTFRWIKWQIRPWLTSKHTIGGLLMFTEDITESKRSEEKIKENQRLFSSLFYKNPIITTIVDVSTRKFIDVNDAALDFWGYLREEMIGKTSADLELMVDFEKRDQIVNSILKDGFIKDAELRVRSRKGEKWLCYSTTLINLNGRDCYLATSTDITSRKEAEARYRNLQVQYHQMIDVVEDYAILQLDTAGNIRSWNTGALKIKGYTADEIIGENFSVFYSQEDRDAGLPQRLIKEATLSKKATAEGWRIRKDRSRFWASIVITSITDQAGNLTGFTKVTQDLTDKKTAEEEVEILIKKLQLNEEKFISILESTPDAVIIVNKERIIQIVNGQTEKLFGYTRDELIGQSNEMLVPEKYKPKRGADGKFISDPVVGSMGSGVEMYGLRKDGTEFPMEMSVSFLEEEGLYFATLRDLTERKRLELQQTTFFNMSSEMLAIAGTDGYFKHINPSFEKTLGFTSEELLSKSFLSFIHPEDVDNTLKEIEKLLEGSTTINFINRYICKDGKYKLLEWTTQPMGEILFAVARDITERSKKEDEIRDSDERNKIFVSKLPGAVAMFDTNMRYLAASEKWIEDYGLGKKQLIGISHYEIFPEISDEWKTIHRDCLNGAINKAEEFYFKREDGTAQWITWDVRPWYISEGKIGGLLMLTADVTERKKALEKEKKYAVLESKTKEMEQFVYVASHDLREPLLTVKNYAKIFIEDYGEQVNTDGLKYLDSICRAANRMDDLIKGLLDYSRLSKSKQIEEVDCNEIVKQVQADLSLLVTKNNAIINTGLLPTLNAFPLEITLLFQNLLNNAIKFKRKDVSPIIDIAAKKIGNGWQFAVKDNGIGISDADKERIFVIFQRLHERSEYEGTGIGLAHCKKIVELHQGQIWIEPAPGGGTTFNFTIMA